MVFRRKPRDEIDGIILEGMDALKELIKAYRKGKITREQKYVIAIATLALMYNSLVSLAVNDEALKKALLELLGQSNIQSGDFSERKAGIM